MAEGEILQESVSIKDIIEKWGNKAKDILPKITQDLYELINEAGKLSEDPTIKRYLTIQRQANILRAIAKGIITPASDKPYRFKILERDKFTCQYCGSKAPEVKLHIDHKLPVSRGGTDEEDNLITACEECNIQKGNRFDTYDYKKK